MIKLIRQFLKLPLTLALRVPFIRRRAAFELHQHYFSDLGIAIPLGEKYACPLPANDSIYSFGEIFVAAEYGRFLELVALPKRWIDLGCHTGYFSLYLAWQHSSRSTEFEWRALLVDADPRMEEFTAQTLARNALQSQCIFRSGLVSKRTGDQEFALRRGMGSSADTGMQGVQKIQKVPVLTPREILATFPPPYDLIKVDIEGAENDFLAAYREVYSHASAIIMEWHSPDREGLNALVVQSRLEAEGFRMAEELRAKRVLKLEGRWYSSGVQLYIRVNQ